MRPMCTLLTINGSDMMSAEITRTITSIILGSTDTFQARLAPTTFGALKEVIQTASGLAASTSA